jgi:drug/metabolite transporter (DMT)-like permease
MGGQHGPSLVGIILIMLGSFSFSCMFLFVKLLQGRANSFVLGFYRALVEIPIALWLCYTDSENPLGPPHRRGWLWVRGGVGAAAVLCFFYAIQHLPLPDAVTLQFTTPPFAAAFAVCVAGEPWLLIDRMGAVVCLLGVMLIAHPSWLFGGTVSSSSSSSTASGAAGSPDSTATEEEEGTTTMLAVPVALLGAALAGLAYTSVRKIGHDASANVMVLYYSVLSIPVTLLGSRLLLGHVNVWGETQVHLNGWDKWWIILTGITAYTGQYLTNLGLQHETAAKGTLATCSQIVFTYIFELVLLHEPINAWSIAGTVLILGFMMVVGIFKMKTANDTIPPVVVGETQELALLFSAEQDVQHDSSTRRESKL